MKRAIFFVLLFTSELVLISQNLVVNPGFEIWEKINKPTGWTTASFELMLRMDCYAKNC